MTILYWKLTHPLPAGTFKSFIFRLLEALQQHIWSLLRLGQGPGLDQRSGRWGLNSHVFLVKTDRVDVIFDYHLFEWKCDEYVMLHVWICAFCDQKTFMMWHWMLYQSCQAMLDTWCLSNSDHSCPTNCKQVYHVLPNKACLWDFFRQHDSNVWVWEKYWYSWKCRHSNMKVDWKGVVMLGQPSETKHFADLSIFR